MIHKMTKGKNKQKNTQKKPPRTKLNYWDYRAEGQVQLSMENCTSTWEITAHHTADN